MAKPILSGTTLLRDALREQRLFSERALVAWLCVILLLLVLLTRLIYLQVFHYRHYAVLSENNRLRILPLPPPRGFIYDRQGRILAANRPAYSLEVVPEQAGDIDELLDKLDDIILLTVEEKNRFQRALRQKRRFEGVTLRLHLTEDEIARFVVKQYQFPGVNIVSSLARYYPLGAQGVHAIGYVGRINERELETLDISNYRGTKYIGKVGVEKTYEALLHGKTGLEHVETNAEGRTLRVIERLPSTPGHNLYLNLDIDLQHFAELQLEDLRGAIVALDPRSGGVLALASAPAYDPNLFVRRMDQTTYRKLNHPFFRPLFNRAVQGVYSPGSTIKPLVSLAGLEYGVIHADQKIWCPGWFSLEGHSHRYRDWKRSGHGSLNLVQSVAQSCDVYFYELANKLGINRLSGFLSRFGLGEKTGIDLTGEARGNMPTPAWKQKAMRQVWYPGETVIAGIGQGYMQTTPLQLAYATAILAMRGKLRQPSMVFLVEDPVSNAQQTIERENLPDIVLKDEAYWDQAIASMVAVVHSPTGTARAQSEGIEYQMAGKTGTAQVISIAQDAEYDEDKIKLEHRDHALFVAFAPVQEPRIALAVIVENGGGGGSTAAPIARQVIDYYLLPEKRTALITALQAARETPDETP